MIRDCSKFMWYNPLFIIGLIIGAILFTAVTVVASLGAGICYVTDKC